VPSFAETGYSANRRYLKGETFEGLPAWIILFISSVTCS
jgi:hypothetical protein